MILGYNMSRQKKYNYDGNIVKSVKQSCQNTQSVYTKI